VDRGVKNLEKRFGVIGGGFFSFLLWECVIAGGDDGRWSENGPEETFSES